MKGLMLLSLLLAASNLFADQNQTATLQEYLSGYKQKEFRYDKEKNKEESLKLRDSWIAPLQLQYRYNKSNPYDKKQTAKNASISLNQPIFRSGGIYYGIQYANATQQYNNYTIDVQKRRAIKETIMLLMQIQQSDLRLKKQKKQVQNSKIKLDQNKEEYLSGQLESGFLDNAIIQLNIVKQALFDIQSSKEKLVSRFKAMSDLEYRSTTTPYLANITKEEFLQHNIVLELYKTAKKRDAYKNDVTVAKYLPALYLNGSYVQDKTSNPLITRPSSTTYYNYGFSVMMPLDFNTFRDIQSSKIDMLKSSVVIEDKKRELVSLYEQVEQNLKNITQKISLAEQNYSIYKKLLEDTTKLFNAGYKTKADVELLQNSADMAKIDMEIFSIDKQLELLNLYEYYYEVQ